MNLTGILKSIILVAVSAVIWVTPVTLLQLIGYSIALAGMFYYSLPPEGLGPQVQAAKAWLGETLLAPDPAAGKSTGTARNKAPPSRFFQLARRWFGRTGYEAVPRQEDVEAQRAVTTTTHQGRPKDAVA